MTIQELKTREENRKKNKKLNKEGRLVVVEVGENYKQKRVFVDGVDVFPFWEKDIKENLSKYDFLQLKEEEEARIKARKEHQEEKAAMLTLFNDFLKNINFMLDAEKMIITTMAGDFVAFIDYGDIKKILEYKEDDKTKYIELLKEKAERSKNWDNNIKALEEAKKSGIIDSFEYRGFYKGGKFYYVDDFYKYRNLDDRGGIVNFIIKRTHEEEEEKAKQEEERQAKAAEVIAVLDNNGVRYNTTYNAFYYKRSKVAQMNEYEEIISYNTYYNSYKLNEKVKKIFNDLELNTNTIESGKEEK